MDLPRFEDLAGSPGATLDALALGLAAEFRPVDARARSPRSTARGRRPRARRNAREGFDRFVDHYRETA